MYQELEVAPDSIRVEDSAPRVLCDCACGEPVPADGDEAPAGNKTAVNLEVHYDING